MINNFKDEYERYKVIGQKALSQVSDEHLNQIIGVETNSMGMIVRHMQGNLRSRFTDFLTSDGEKPWRNREDEFAQVKYERAQIDQMWDQGWGVLFQALDGLNEADAEKQVSIRGQALTVHEALTRSLAHIAYHVGQIVMLARILSTKEWEWISIPKGKSKQYNQNPTMEKKMQ